MTTWKLLAEPPACPVTINTISFACEHVWPVSSIQFQSLGLLHAGGIERTWHTSPQCHLNVGQRRTQWPGIGLMHVTLTHCRLYQLFQHDALKQSWVDVSPPPRLWRWLTFSVAAKTTRYPNIGLMVAQRHRRWANISPALVERLVFDHLHDRKCPTEINGTYRRRERTATNWVVKLSGQR